MTNEHCNVYVNLECSTRRFEVFVSSGGLKDLVNEVRISLNLGPLGSKTAHLAILHIYLCSALGI